MPARHPYRASGLVHFALCCGPAYEERFSLASRRTCAPIEPPAVEGATVS